MTTHAHSPDGQINGSLRRLSQLTAITLGLCGLVSVAAQVYYLQPYRVTQVEREQAAQRTIIEAGREARIKMMVILDNVEKLAVENNQMLREHLMQSRKTATSGL